MAGDMKFGVKVEVTSTGADALKKTENQAAKSAENIRQSYERASAGLADAVAKAVDSAEKDLSSLEKTADSAFSSIGDGASKSEGGAKTLLGTLAEILGVAGEVADAGGNIAESLTGISEGAASLSDLQSRFGTLALAAAGAVASIFAIAAAIKGIANAAEEIVRVNAEFQSLQASLETVMGTAGAARDTFLSLENLAGQTPFSVKELNEAFITLSSRGLPSGQRALISFGNTASSMAKPLQQFIEAVADAASGEFERLKEFGIQAEKQGEKIQFTFQGVKTEVQNSSEKIGEYLTKLGEKNFAGAMERQMQTLTGAISNASDAWARFLRELGEAGVNAAIDKAIRWFTKLVDKASEFIDKMDVIENRSSTSGLKSEMERVGNQLTELKKRRSELLELSEKPISGTGVAGSSWYTPAGIKKYEIPKLDKQISDLEQEFSRLFKTMERIPLVVQGKRVRPEDERDPYGEIIEAAAKAFGVDPNFVRAIAKAETGHIKGETRESARSPKGAMGIMQIMPGTWKEITAKLRKQGVNLANPDDPSQSIFAGTFYLKQQLDRFGSMKLAAAAYNAGPERKSLAEGIIPPFAETQKYVQRVMSFFDKLSKDSGVSRFAADMAMSADRAKDAAKLAEKQEKEGEQLSALANRTLEKHIRDRERIESENESLSAKANQSLEKRTQDRIALEDDADQALAKLFKLKGGDRAAFALDQAAEYAPLERKLREFGMESGLKTVQELRSAESAKFEFNEVAKRFEDGISKLTRILEIGGGPTPLRGGSEEFIKGLAGARSDIEEMSSLYELLKDPATSAALDKSIQKFVALKQESGAWNSVLVSTVSTLTDSLASAMTGIVTGTESVSEAFKGMSVSVVQSLTQILTKMLAVAAMESVIKGVRDIGAIDAGMATALLGAVAHHTGGIVGGSGVGGRAAGPLRSNERLAILEIGEEVLPRYSPRHQWNFQMPGPPRYHDGGIAGLESGVASASAQQVSGGDAGTRVVLVDDQRSVGDWISSSAGERTILSVLQRKRGQVREILA